MRLETNSLTRTSRVVTKDGASPTGSQLEHPCKGRPHPHPHPTANLSPDLTRSDLTRESRPSLAAIPWPGQAALSCAPTPSLVLSPQTRDRGSSRKRGRYVCRHAVRSLPPSPETPVARESIVTMRTASCPARVARFLRWVPHIHTRTRSAKFQTVSPIDRHCAAPEAPCPSREVARERVREPRCSCPELA
jgi:hypothetical protein